MRPIHSLLGYAGLLPFAGLVLIALFPENPLSVIFSDLNLNWHLALLSYAALIYSFIAGIYWHVSLQVENNQQANIIALWSVSLMLWGWGWVVFSPAITFLWIGLSFWALPLLERIWLKAYFKDAFMRLRTHLSMTVGSLLLLLHLAT